MFVCLFIHFSFTSISLLPQDAPGTLWDGGVSCPGSGFISVFYSEMTKKYHNMLKHTISTENP